jgi:hypothetical protein
MALIQLLQRLAVLVSARDAAALLILAATFCTTVVAFLRAPSGLRRHRLTLGAVALGALLLVVSPRGCLPVTVVTGIAIAVFGGLTWHAFANRPKGDDLAIEEPASKHGTALWIGAASIVAVLFLLTDLGGYSGSLMNWEPESMRGLVEASQNGVSWPRFAISRLLWGRGLVSTGHDSLLFGSGTYAMWRLWEISPSSLRLMAALLAAACLPAAYGTGRAIGGRKVATAALVVIAVNPVLLFYGRYGTSLTATFFAVLLLLWLFLKLLDPNLNSRSYGLAAAGAAFLATLGYATGRVLAVAVVTTALLYGIRRWRRLPLEGRRVFIVIASVLAVVCCVQAAFDRSREFVSVNREHIMTTDVPSEWVEALLGEDADSTHLSLNDRLVMTKRVTVAALADLRTVLSFSFNRSTHPWLVLGGDPPELPLAQGPVILFALWGFSLSLAAWRHRWPLLLVVALAAASLPLLLTTRVDVHRMSLAALPLVLWAAMGLVAASRVMRECRVPAAACHVVAAMLLMLVAADNSSFLFYPESPQRSPLVSAVEAGIDPIREPVVVGIANDWRSEAEIELFLLDCQRLDSRDRSELLWQETVSKLTDDSGPDAMAIVQIEGVLHDATVILAPRGDFDAAISALDARGMKARTIGDDQPGLWRLDRLPRGDIPELEKIELPRDLNPRPRRLRTAPQGSDRRELPLIGAEVRAVYHGSSPPQIETAREGKQIVMGGATYGFGISMNAWTHMRFYVPASMVALEGVIGFSDTVSGCDRALVTFEVWDNDNRRIFDSGPFSAGMAPRHIRVPLRDTSTITLVVTEGGNGHECDQVLWAEPFFTIAR